MTRTLIISLGLLAATLFAAPAEAKTPDGSTPAEETICDDFSGNAFGLCNAYCEAQDCDVSPGPSCTQLQTNFDRATGLSDFPCDCVPPSFFDPSVGCVCPVDLVLECAALGGTLNDACECTVPLCSQSDPNDQACADGVCPPDELCDPDGVGGCGCEPECGFDVTGLCGGACPDGETCQNGFDSTLGYETCLCAPELSCGETSPPVCGGTCPTGLTCQLSVLSAITSTSDFNGINGVIPIGPTGIIPIGPTGILPPPPEIECVCSSAPPGIIGIFPGVIFPGDF